MEKNTEDKTKEKVRVPQLHYWYLEEIEIETETDKKIIANGIVTGHPKFVDSLSIHTSEVIRIEIKEELEAAIIKTENTTYHCPLAYCRWRKQDSAKQLIPNYDEIKEKYKDKEICPEIEAGKVLLVLSNFNDYYFNSLYYKPDDAMERLSYRGYPHVGMFQDSYLIGCEGTTIDIRYFPHYQNIEFYSEDTMELPFYIENIGDVILYAQTKKGLLKLEPGERKEVCEPNFEKVKVALDDSDLYPAIRL